MLKEKIAIPVLVSIYFLISIGSILYFLVFSLPPPLAEGRNIPIQINNEVLKFENKPDYINFRNNLIEKRKTSKLDYNEYRNLLKIYDFEIKRLNGITIKDVNKENVFDKIEELIKEKGIK